MYSLEQYEGRGGERSHHIHPYGCQTAKKPFMLILLISEYTGEETSWEKLSIHIVKYDFEYGSLSKIETIVELFIELPSLLGESKGFI